MAISMKKSFFNVFLAFTLLLHVPCAAAEQNSPVSSLSKGQSQKIRLSAEQIAKLKVLLAAKKQQQEKLTREKALQAEKEEIQRQVQKQRVLEAQKREQRLKEYETKLIAKREAELKAQKQLELERALAAQKEADRQAELSAKEAIRRKILEGKKAAVPEYKLKAADKIVPERRTIYRSNEPVEIDSIDQLNFNYIQSSEKYSWSPTLVFDNGIETYIRIPEGFLDDTFAVTGVHSNGDTYAGAYRIQQDFIVLSGIYDHIRIRKGDQTIIVRYKLPDNLGF